MTIDFERAKWSADQDGAWLCIRVPSPATATQWLDQMQEGKTYTAELKQKRQKRSLDANAYYWLLAGKLADRMQIPPEQIYLHHIRDVGNYEVYCMQETALETFARLWVSGHLGRLIQTRESKLPGCVTVLAYYGSSDFDTRQMTRLIDNCIQDCKALGIETRSPEEVESLLAQWHDKTDKSAGNQPGGETPGL